MIESPPPIQINFDLTGERVGPRYSDERVGLPQPSSMRQARAWLRRYRARSKAILALPIDWTQPLYLRFGDWQGSSRTHLRLEHEGSEFYGDFERRGEAGLSVYGVSPAPWGWQFHRLNCQEALYHLGSDYWKDMIGAFVEQGRSAYLALGVVDNLVPVMRQRGVSRVARSARGFLAAYRKARGRHTQIGKDAGGVAWRDRRNAFVARHMGQVVQCGEPLWGGDGSPTRRHLALVAWAYSPEPEKLVDWLTVTM